MPDAAHDGVNLDPGSLHDGINVDTRKRRKRRRRRRRKNRQGVDTDLKQNTNQISQGLESSVHSNVSMKAVDRAQENIMEVDSAVRLNAKCQSSVRDSTTHHLEKTLESGNEISRGMLTKKSDPKSGPLGLDHTGVMPNINLLDVSGGVTDGKSTRKTVKPQDSGFFVRNESPIYAPQRVNGVDYPSEIKTSDLSSGAHLGFGPRHFVNGSPAVYSYFGPHHFVNGSPAVNSYFGPHHFVNGSPAANSSFVPQHLINGSPAANSHMVPHHFVNGSPAGNSFVPHHFVNGPPASNSYFIPHHFVNRSLAVCTRRKLLVLDINGLLADIVMPAPQDYKADTHISGRAIFKRPFYYDFLMFCCERFDVGIWSSRSKKIIDKVVNYLLGDFKHKLLFCWNMLHCTETSFKTLENKHKPLVFKELRKLWEKHDPDLPWEMGAYNETNTVLLDDSPYKALLNPINTAIFPYSFHYGDEKDNSLGPRGDLRVYLEGLAKTDNVQKYIEQHPFGQGAIDERSSLWSFYSTMLYSCSVQDTKRR